MCTYNVYARERAEETGREKNAHSLTPNEALKRFNDKRDKDGNKNTNTMAHNRHDTDLCDRDVPSSLESHGMVVFVRYTIDTIHVHSRNAQSEYGTLGLFKH